MPNEFRLYRFCARTADFEYAPDVDDTAELVVLFTRPVHLAVNGGSDEQERSHICALQAVTFVMCASGYT